MKRYAALLFLFVAFLPYSGRAAFVFESTLRQGITSPEVKILQQTLNKDASTQIATYGVGSPGYETNYFGSLTHKAVVAFQMKHGLTPDGIVGPKSRAKLNTLSGVSASPTTSTQIDYSSNLYTQIPKLLAEEDDKPIVTSSSSYLSITSIEPENPQPGDTLDIYGTGFTRTSKVYVGSNGKVPFDLVNSKHIKLEIPDDAEMEAALIYVQNPVGDTSWTDPVFAVITDDEISSGNLKDVLKKVQKENDFQTKIIAEAKRTPRQIVREIFSPIKRAYAISINNFFGGSISETTTCTCYYNFGIILEIDDIATHSTVTTVYKPGMSTLHSNYNVFSSGPNVIGGTMPMQFQCENTAGYVCESSGDSADSQIDLLRGVGTSIYDFPSA